MGEFSPNKPFVGLEESPASCLVSRCFLLGRFAFLKTIQLLRFLDLAIRISSPHLKRLLTLARC